MDLTPAKLLLLGEYTVLDGGPSLAVPLPGRGGEWVDTSDAPDPRLLLWYEWMQGRKGLLSPHVDLQGFGHFIRQGGRFASDIPTGFGLGSSGALVAAFVRRWYPDYPQDPGTLQQELAFLESYFHGKSSGLDPLVSLTSQAVRLDGHGHTHLHTPPRAYPGLFLLDSGQARETSPLVAQYRSLSALPAFRALLPGYFDQLRAATDAILTSDTGRLYVAFKAISRFQARWMTPMILPGLQPYWDNDPFLLKLCGAGGGGFYLGMTTTGQLPAWPYPVHWVDDRGGPDRT